MPAFSTIVPPPNDIEDGCISIYDTNEDNWKIVKDTFWHVTYIEINYYTGSDTKGIPLLPSYQMDKFMKFKNIPQLFNVALFGVNFTSRLDTINNITKKIYEQHYKFFSGSVISPTELTTYKNNIEFVVYLIKKSIDELITLTFCLLNYDDLLLNKVLRITSIGELLSARDDDMTRCIKEYINFDKHSDFLRIINSVHNSMKHDIFSSEAASVIGASFPTIITLQADRGNLNKLKYHNHSYGQIIIGFSNFLKDLL